MPSPTLQDQMGAMALIDELRQRRLNLQQHMNLPLHRTEVATKIRDYYLNQNIIVGDDVIDAGVRAYFDRRLRFDPPNLQGWRYRFADMWINRAGLLKKSIRPVVFTLVSAIVVVTTFNAIGNYVAQDRAQERQQVVNEHKALLAKIDEQEKATEAVINRHADMPFAPRIGKDALSLIGLAKKTGSTTSTVLSMSPKGLNSDARKSSRKSISEATQLVGRAAVLTQQMESLAFAYKRLLKLQNDPQYQRRLAQTPELMAATNAAREALKMALEEANENSSAAAISLAGEVLSAARQKNTGATASQQAADILGELQIMGLPSLTMARLTGKVASVASASSVEAANKIVVDLENTLDYARAPLRVKLLNREGQLTGDVHSSLGFPGGTHFLYAELVDPVGKVYSMPNSSSDDADKAWAQSIGVQVDESLFEKVRKDKTADGVIEDPFIGTKPANSLDIHFAEGVSKNPKIIYYGR